MDLSFDTLFQLVLALAVVGFFGYRMIRHGSFTAANFGARIDRTVGEIGAENHRLSIILKVHILRRDPSERLVGIEVAEKNILTKLMTPVMHATLSVSQAEELALLLQNAVHTD